MPMHVYLKGGGKLSLKGDTFKAAVVRNWALFFRRIWMGVAMNGHEIFVTQGSVMAWELQPEQEAKKIEEAERAQRELMAQASKCRRCGTMSPREADFCARCGSPLVKKQIEEPRLVVPGGRP